MSLFSVLLARVYLMITKILWLHNNIIMLCGILSLSCVIPSLLCCIRPVLLSLTYVACCDVVGVYHRGDVYLHRPARLRAEVQR